MYSKIFDKQKRKISLGLLLLWILPQASFALVRTDVEDIREVQTHAVDLLQKDSNLKASELAVEWDVDGVMTDFSEPEDLPSSPLGNLFFVPRIHADQVVRFLYNLGVKMIASSAHADILETLGKLRNLGLEKEFAIGANSDTISGEFNSFRYKKNGFVVSVGDKSEYEFSRKAYAPAIAFTAEEFAKIKRIIYVDDRKDLIKIYEQDAPVALPGKQVDYFNLTQVGEEFRPIGNSTAERAVSPFLRNKVHEDCKRSFQEFISKLNWNGDADRNELFSRIQDELPLLRILFRDKRKQDPQVIEQAKERLRLFDSQARLYEIEHSKIQDGRSFIGVVRTAVVLQTLGIPFAISTSRQKQYVLPLMTIALKELGFSENEIRIAMELVANNLLSDLALELEDSGSFFPKNIDVKTKEMHQKFRQMADSLHIRYEDGYKFAHVIHIAEIFPSADSKDLFQKNSKPEVEKIIFQNRTYGSSSWKEFGAVAAY